MPAPRRSAFRRTLEGLMMLFFVVVLSGIGLGAYKSSTLSAAAELREAERRSGGSRGFAHSGGHTAPTAAAREEARREAAAALAEERAQLVAALHLQLALDRAEDAARRDGSRDASRGGAVPSSPQRILEWLCGMSDDATHALALGGCGPHNHSLGGMDFIPRPPAHTAGAPGSNGGTGGGGGGGGGTATARAVEEEGSLWATVFRSGYMVRALVRAVVRARASAICVSARACAVDTHQQPFTRNRCAASGGAPGCFSASGAPEVQRSLCRLPVGCFWF
jgi:hypothetical protein